MKRKDKQEGNRVSEGEGEVERNLNALEYLLLSSKVRRKGGEKERNEGKTRSGEGREGRKEFYWNRDEIISLISYICFYLNYCHSYD